MARFWTLKAGKPDLRLGKQGKASRPAVGRGWVAFGSTVWSPEGEAALTPSKLPSADTVLAAGDVDGDGDEDLVEFRYGKEPHTGNEVLLRRAVSRARQTPTTTASPMRKRRSSGPTL